MVSNFGFFRDPRVCVPVLHLRLGDPVAAPRRASAAVAPRHSRLARGRRPIAAGRRPLAATATAAWWPPPRGRHLVIRAGAARPASRSRVPRRQREGGPPPPLTAIPASVCPPI
ncbi:hypothetical protein EVAR_56901_1 [Eumeta japonica]|uniref:Uncharacterized protein n=1 Tax=Eumeta variegata TaxID=151549 RepID=A0A4C1YBG6_EUMVA|nr:hypothetical protein EVAR_56901_1 [Eumeta japonica]